MNMKYHPAMNRMSKQQLIDCRDDNMRLAKGMRGSVWKHLVEGYVSTARAAHHYYCGFEVTR